MSIADSVKESITLPSVHTKILSATLTTLVQFGLTSVAAFSVLTVILPDTGPDDDTGTGPEPSAPTAATGGKYVPPILRGAGGVRAPGESMRGPGNRDDLPTLRVTNISEDTQENDLRELFGGFGKVARVYVGRDRETGAGKGFAFVSFDDKAAAQKAIDKVNGRGYDNLILSVQWSRKFVHVHLSLFLMEILLNRTSA